MEFNFMATLKGFFTKLGEIYYTFPTITTIVFILLLLDVFGIFKLPIPGRREGMGGLIGYTPSAISRQDAMFPIRETSPWGNISAKKEPMISKTALTGTANEENRKKLLKFM